MVPEVFFLCKVSITSFFLIFLQLTWHVLSIDLVSKQSEVPGISQATFEPTEAVIQSGECYVQQQYHCS